MLPSSKRSFVLLYWPHISSSSVKVVLEPYTTVSVVPRHLARCQSLLELFKKPILSCRTTNITHLSIRGRISVHVSKNPSRRIFAPSLANEPALNNGNLDENSNTTLGPQILFLTNYPSSMFHAEASHGILCIW